MTIALINENSQAAKNGIIEAALTKVVEPMGHEVVNYGMYAVSYTHLGPFRSLPDRAWSLPRTAARRRGCTCLLYTSRCV